MKHFITRTFAVLLVLCLSLALAPVALMEETDEEQEQVVENATKDVVVEQATESVVEEVAESKEEESSEPGETSIEADEEFSIEPEEEIETDKVEAYVGEEAVFYSGEDEVEVYNDEPQQEEAVDEASMFLAEASSSFDVLSNSTTFSVQGKSISASQVANQNNCWTYASLIYQRIWGTSFSSDFPGSASAGWNSLRQLSDANRTLTVDHLKTFIGNAQVGATLRICGCTSSCSSWGNDSLACGHRGHSVVIVQKDANGFTTVENSRATSQSSYAVWTRYYSWQGFVNYWGNSGYSYIKYIKWPNAPTYTNDTTKPILSNAKITNISSSGYTVTCNVSDNVGVSEVVFPTWTEQNGQDDIIWKAGTISGNVASFNVKTSEHNNETGCVYITHIYAYDAARNYSSVAVSCTVPRPDTTKPTISNIKISNLGYNGYTVSCTVSDNVGVTKVCFPTWTEQNGQDDLIWHVGTISGNTASYNVKASEHKNETGCVYITHIYVYDAAGNFGSAGTSCNVPTLSNNNTSKSSTTGTESDTQTRMQTITVTKNTKSKVYVGTKYQIDLKGKSAKSFKSSKTKVATVNSPGVIIPKAKGKAKITIKLTNRKKYTLTLTVKDLTIPSRVTLNKSGTIGVKMGNTITLKATLPAGTNSAIKWTSSNKKVATVNNGVVTFKKKGKVTITATAVRGKKKAKVKFKVSK